MLNSSSRGSANARSMNTCSIQSRSHLPSKPVTNHRKALWRASPSSLQLAATPCRCLQSSLYQTQHLPCQSTGLASSLAGIAISRTSHVGFHSKPLRCGSPALAPHSDHSWVPAQKLPALKVSTNSSSSGTGSSSKRGSGGSSSSRGSKSSTSINVHLREKAAQLWGRAPASSNSSSRAGRSSNGGSSGSSLLSSWFPGSSAPKGVTIKSGQSQSITRKTGSRGSKNTNGGPDGDDDDDVDSEGWQWFSWRKYNRGWQVPWGPGTTVLGVTLWILSFVLVGFLVVPGAYRLAGVDFTKLGADGRATFTLVTQVVETAATLAIVRGLTAKSIAEEESGKGKALQSLSLRPKQEGDGSLELFRYSLSEPFTASRGWLAWGLLGIVLSPLVVGSVATLISTFGYEEAVGGRGTVDGVAGMIETGPATYLSLLTVTGVLAPILEETLFRGFLLTSLSTYMPAWAAVIASSGAFGLAHFSLRDLPVLFSLGVLLGFSYVRSRNLLTPIIIHGAWNSAVLSLLFALSASGVDVQQLLSEMR